MKVCCSHKGTMTSNSALQHRSWQSVITWQRPDNLEASLIAMGLYQQTFEDRSHCSVRGPHGWSSSKKNPLMTKRSSGKLCYSRLCFIDPTWVLSFAEQLNLIKQHSVEWGLANTQQHKSQAEQQRLTTKIGMSISAKKIEIKMNT